MRHFFKIVYNANFVNQILYYEVYYNIDENAFKNSCWY